MSNNISFVGRIGQTPELKDVGSSQVLEFTTAHDVGHGERKVTNWTRCAIWGTRGVKLEPHLTKGNQVFISGELTLRKYTNKDGVEKLSPEINVSSIDFVGGKSDEQSAPRTPAEPRQDDGGMDTESELPF